MSERETTFPTHAQAVAIASIEWAVRNGFGEIRDGLFVLTAAGRKLRQEVCSE